MLLYYFRDKADLLEAVLVAAANGLVASLAAAIPGAEPLPPAELFERVGDFAASARMQPYMRLWSEMSSAAGRGEQPVAAIADRIVAGFAAWAEARLAVADATERKELAALLLVQIDGGALLEPFADGSYTLLARRAIVRLLA